MGLIANVYVASAYIHGPDTSNNGWSSKYTTACVVNAEGPFEPSDDCPAVLIVRHRSLSTLHAKLLSHHESGQWVMMGGNFLHSSDSRFGKLCRNLLEEDGVRADKYWSVGAIPIHDRIED